jgi:ABC-2 type transport system ATP-binding protein
MDTLVIEVNDLLKTYNNLIALDKINFNVRQGEIFGLLGPNGAGKTSTLECLEGLRKPDGGSLLVAGINPISDFRKLRNIIGVQLQSAGLPESITPDEAMKIFSAYHHVEPRMDLLDRFGLTDKRHAQFFSLSAGQQRRLTLALALAHDPQIIFMDEPTAGLDVATRVELHDIMRELKMGQRTIILATHDMAEAEQLADRVAILLHGKIVMIGTPMEITATGAGLTKISVRTQNNCLSGMNIPEVKWQTFKDDYYIYFSSNIGISISAILSHLEKNAELLIDLRVQRPSLEDRFLEITGKGDQL